MNVLLVLLLILAVAKTKSRSLIGAATLRG